MFSNIYLNELDRFVKHHLRVKSYLRYGDDFVLFGEQRDMMDMHRSAVRSFLSEELHLTVHKRNDVIFPCSDGLRFLGCNIFPAHRHLKKQSWNRVLKRTDLHNVSSYHGLVHAHSDQMTRKYFDWRVMELLDHVE